MFRKRWERAVAFWPLSALCVTVFVFSCPHAGYGQSPTDAAQESDIGLVQPAASPSSTPPEVSSDGIALANTAVSSGGKEIVPPTSDSNAAGITPDGVALPGTEPEGMQADADLGEQWVMKKNQKTLPFNVFADATVFHTSNVALSHSLELSDWFLVTTVGASYSRPFANIWNLNLFVSDSFFRYNKFSELDFNSLNAGAGISVQVHRLWDTIWSLQYSVNILNGRSSVGQLFNGHSFNLGASKSIRFSSADSLIYGLGGALNIADPSSLNRADLGGFATYTVALTRHLSVGGTIRESMLKYTDGSRRDFSSSLALSGRYIVNKWFSLSATAAGTYNQSNEPVFEYKVFNFGLGLSGNIQF